MLWYKVYRAQLAPRNHLAPIQSNRIIRASFPASGDRLLVRFEKGREGEETAYSAAILFVKGDLRERAAARV